MIMRHSYHIIILQAVLFLLAACSVSVPDNAREEASLPAIFPDYINVTIPANIAPLRFALADRESKAVCELMIEGDNAEPWVVEAEDGKFLFDEGRWHDFMATAREHKVRVNVYQQQNGEWIKYKAFHWEVASDDIDSHLAYRLLPPGYEPWLELGIYQRDLTSYEETPIMENRHTEHNCMNCHSFCMQQPDKMMLHMRQQYGGTYILSDGEVEHINGKVNPSTGSGQAGISNLVYPSWHPSGDFIAFSSNDIHQIFHMHDRNRIEVLDASSDVVVYDVKRHEVVTCPQLMADDRFETFPTFSPDGKTLFFCSAQMPDSLPAAYRKVKYSLCAISYDPASRSFGSEVDTLYNARTEGRSAKFPRVSPDGKHLVFTLSDYGNFSIWHKDADLYIVNLADRSCRPMKEANSNDVDSYHSWSSNSRWMVFSSRRDDGLYTRPYFTYIDAKGQEHKPFLLPQADPDFYLAFMKSYNIPELITGPVPVGPKDFTRAAHEEGKPVKMGQ